jgi:threonylcarbamoyladenosine tRNA methylthiotransferase MtaB
VENGRKIAYHTLGCKLNFAETSSIGRQFKAAGYERVEFFEKPDLFLINTCSVTENADRECRTIVKRAMKVNSEAIIIVTGCFAQLKPDSIALIPGVDLVLGASEKFNAPAHVENLFHKGNAIIKACDINDVHSFSSSWSTGERTRVFLKVQDGCNYNCSFCTIPLARGSSRSNTIDNIVNQVKDIVQSGVKEIVLTGINLGDFGIDTITGERISDFKALVKAVDAINGLERVRISSIEPNLLENDIVDLIAGSKKFVPHFHIPLQSGCDKILKSMKRRYLTRHYADKIEYINKRIPGCCIGVDVITGFPGESDADFIETYKFINSLNISYLHVFTYSERNNTAATELGGVVPVEVRKMRNKQLRILSAKKQRSFYESYLGSIQPVLFEADNSNGEMHGYTPAYIKVKTKFDPALTNTIMDCRLEKVDENGEVLISMIESRIA